MCCAPAFDGRERERAVSRGELRAEVLRVDLGRGVRGDRALRDPQQRRLARDRFTHASTRKARAALKVLIVVVVVVVVAREREREREREKREDPPLGDDKYTARRDPKGSGHSLRDDDRCQCVRVCVCVRVWVGGSSW